MIQLIFSTLGHSATRRIGLEENLDRMNSVEKSKFREKITHQAL